MQSVFSMATLSLALAATGVAAQAPAQNAPSASFALPHAYQGYSQPEITQCATTGALKRDCVVPAMTAGRYVIVAGGSATSTGADATQSLSINLNGQPCTSVNSAPFTGQKGLPPVVCQVNFLTDQALTITAAYSVKNATPDPAGPRLIVRRIPWSGVLEARGGVAPPRPAAVKK